MLQSKLQWAPWPHFDQEMIEASSRVLQSGKVNYWTADIHTLSDGTQIRGETGLFEHEFAQYHNAPNALAVSNGTIALELALNILGISKDDQVIVPSRTYIASATCCITQGAIPVFADIDPTSQNISAQTIAPLINKKTKAIIAVHLAGWACEIDDIKELITQKELEYDHRIYLIEDCAQCLGGEYKGQKLGTFGDASCFSFCQDKIITTGGEGGMVMFKEEEHYQKAWSYREHGKDFIHFSLNHKSPKYDEKPLIYTEAGSNYRMTEMQATIGRIALAQLDSWNLAKRESFASKLYKSLHNIKGLKTYQTPSHIKHANYKFYFCIQDNELQPEWNRDKILKAIQKHGIPANFGSNWELNREGVWKKLGLENYNDLHNNFPNDKVLGESSIMLQIHPTLTEDHIEATINAIKSIMAQATQ